MEHDSNWEPKVSDFSFFFQTDSDFVGNFKIFLNKMLMIPIYILLEGEKYF